jgi:nicotinamidase-related amidase
MTHHRVHDTQSRMVRIEATPEPIAIETARTAVLVVDMQHDFGAKGGMFDRAGIDISMIQRAIGPTARVLAAARKTGVTIVYLKMGFVPTSRTSVLPTHRTGCGICGSVRRRDHACP